MGVEDKKSSSTNTVSIPPEAVEAPRTDALHFSRPPYVKSMVQRPKAMRAVEIPKIDINKFLPK